MNSTEEEKDNSKWLEKIISLFLLLFFFQNWFYLREGGGWGRVHPETCRVSASASAPGLILTLNLTLKQHSLKKR